MIINEHRADRVRPRKRPLKCIEDEDDYVGRYHASSSDSGVDKITSTNKIRRKQPSTYIEEGGCRPSPSSVQSFNAALDKITSDAATQTLHKKEDNSRKRKGFTSNLPKHSAPISTRDSMCRRCRSIDLDTVFDCAAYKGEVSTVFDLGNLAAWSQTCTLCCRLRNDALSLPLRMREARGPGQSHTKTNANKCTWELRRCSTEHLIAVGCKRKQESKLKHWSTVVLCPASWSCSPNTTPVSTYLTFCFQMILPISRSPVKVLEATFDGVSRIVPPRVDFAPIRAWLERCNNEHSCSIKSQVDVLHLDRVIGCQTRKLVPWSRQEYVALSYVWGSRSRVTVEEDMETRTSLQLPSQLPRTIDDAITATLEIRKRFLWVDRYCIDQYHSEQKAQQIKAMADVYEQATVTIVALSEDADVGLYGISLTRPVEQIALQSSTRIYISTLPTLQQCFERSVYKSRAWAYQETALSRRCLVFTPSQVHFTCRSHTICESLPLPFAEKSESAQGWHACLRNPVALPWSRSPKASDSY